MKRLFSLALSTLVMLAFLASPARADFSLSLNDRYAGSSHPVELVDGRGMVSLDTIDLLFGADITVANETIKVVENDKILLMKVGSEEASLNDTSLSLETAPQEIDNIIMVPLASVCEALGAKVEWIPERERINVVYKEARNDMSAADVMAKYTEEYKNLNTYKFKGKSMITTRISTSGLPEGKTGNITMNIDEQLSGSISQEPVQAVMSIKIRIDSPDIPQTAQATQNMEIYLNEECMYMRMPDGALVKMDSEGFDIKSLTQNQGGLQDLQTLLEEIQKNNLIMSFNNDQSKQGVDYWVISTTIDSETFEEMFKGIMKQLSGAVPKGQSSDSQSFTMFMNDFASKMQMNMTMNIWIDQKTNLARYGEGFFDMQWKMPVPATEEGQSDGLLDMNMQGTTSIEYYDYGGKLVWPNLDNAIGFNQYLLNNITVTSN